MYEIPCISEDVAGPRGVRASDLGLRCDYVYYDLLDRS